MTTKSYSLIAALIFAIVAILQLSRAIMGVQLVVGSHTMPSMAELGCVCGCWHACLARI